MSLKDKSFLAEMSLLHYSLLHKSQQNVVFFSVAFVFSESCILEYFLEYLLAALKSQNSLIHEQQLSYVQMEE